MKERMTPIYTNETSMERERRQEQDANDYKMIGHMQL